MRSRKLPTILVAVAFFIVVAFSCVFAFSVSEVRADFSATGGFDAETVQNKLDGYKGKNLIFFNEQTIKEDLEKDPFIEVTAIRKEFPNVVRVSVKERIRAFRLSLGEETAVLSTEGYVLERSADSDFSEDKLFDLNLNGITVTGATLGKKITTDNDELFYMLVEMANYIDLTDTASGLTFNKREFNEAAFAMRTGVNIRLQVGLEKNFGLDMIGRAFDAYNGKLLNSEGKAMSDYEKFSSSIIVTRKADGSGINVTWSKGI